MSRRWLVCIVAWLIPGGGHLIQKRRDKGLVFLVAIPLMFGIGLWLSGRLFPLEWNDPLVFLGAIADRGVGVPYFIARLMDAGAGTVTDQSYEYGNTFLMTAGLLNFLVILDAFDIAMGRKPLANEPQRVSPANLPVAAGTRASAANESRERGESAKRRAGERGGAGGAKPAGKP
jgi:hypothetical protein